MPIPIEDIRIHYELATFDHVPFSLCINVGNMPSFMYVSNDLPVGKIMWSSSTEKDMWIYSTQCGTMLSNVELPKHAVNCNDINCKNPQHRAELCSLYDNIVDCLLMSSQHLYKTKTFKVNRGWNEYVEEIHAEARRAFKVWAESGRPKYGPTFEYMKRAN